MTTNVIKIPKQISLRVSERDYENITHIQELLGEKTASKAILRALEDYVTLKERAFWLEEMLNVAAKGGDK